jgi:hypothetical protein
MRHPAPLVAATVAATLLFGAGTAAAEELKPVSREAAKLPAVDADASAAAARIDAEGSALGSYWDPERGELVVVVGPDSAIGEPEAEKLVAGSPYRLEHQKIAKKTADGIRERLASEEFAPAAERYGYSSHLDLQTGKVVVESPEPAAFEGLLKEHPDEVELVESKPIEDTFHRRDDVNPFWGGAAIQSGGSTCSTGFSVRKPSGARFITTAAHCYPLGAVVRTPTGTFVGTVQQRGTLGSIFFWINRDVELIGGQSYAARVYTGGVFSTSSKAVVGAGDPVAGFTGYCTSGQTSGEQCNQAVQSTSALACTQSGCKWPIIRYTGGPSQPGDSGGSMYLPGASGQVFARGSVIAGNGVSSFAEPWSRMSSAMGVSIAL